MRAADLARAARPSWKTTAVIVVRQAASGRFFIGLLEEIMPLLLADARWSAPLKPDRIRRQF
jgi:hypothetical protein